MRTRDQRKPPLPPFVPRRTLFGIAGLALLLLAGAPARSSADVDDEPSAGDPIPDQLAVSGENGKYPEHAGNVKTVEARDYWRDKESSPTGQGDHYNQNAETYLLVGDALGRGMAELLEQGK